MGGACVWLGYVEAARDLLGFYLSRCIDVVHVVDLLPGPSFLFELDSLCRNRSCNANVWNVGLLAEGLGSKVTEEWGMQFGGLGVVRDDLFLKIFLLDTLCNNNCSNLPQTVERIGVADWRRWRDGFGDFGVFAIEIDRRDLGCSVEGRSGRSQMSRCSGGNAGNGGNHKDQVNVGVRDALNESVPQEGGSESRGMYGINEFSLPWPTVCNQ